MVRFGIALLVVGGVMGFFGIQECRLRSAASTTPQEISLKDLIAHGPENNAHVIVKDYSLCENFIYEKPEKSNADTWNKVWIPAVPAQANAQQKNGLAAKPNHVDALIKSKHVHKESELARLAGPTVQGMVVNKIESLGSEEKKKLSETYPGTDFSKCLIIEEGREPAGPGKLAALVGGGLLLLLVGGAVALFGFTRRK